jgi:hypothetical protein
MGLVKGIRVAPVLVLLAFAALACFVLAGCGSGSSTNTSSPSANAPTKAQFVAQADAMCEKTSERLNAQYLVFQKEHKGLEHHLSTSERVEVAKGIGRERLESQLKSLKSMEAPVGEEAKVKAILATLEHALTAGEGNPLALLVLYKGPLQKFQESSQAYGFKVCGQQ